MNVAGGCAQRIETTGPVDATRRREVTTSAPLFHSASVRVADVPGVATMTQRKPDEVLSINSPINRRRFALMAAASTVVTACGGGGSGSGTSSANVGESSPPPSSGTFPVTPPSPTPPSTPQAPTNPPAPENPPAPTKSAKRGIAYDLANAKDFEVLSPGVSWWYDWSATPASGTSATWRAQYGIDFIPTLWNGNFNDAQIEQLLLSDPKIRFLLVLNEPNLTDQANLSPQAAAALWPRFEAIARKTGVKIVGPQITWGTMPGYQDPVAWLDAFYTVFRSANGIDPTIDYLGFHWYDYGLAGQLDRLTRYGKPFWVTELANWHNGDGAAQIDTAAKQMAQMADMVGTCEARPDVFRYAWFTGRLGANDQDVHHTALLAGADELTDVGRHYITLPF
jgi:hypothetical protein